MQSGALDSADDERDRLPVSSRHDDVWPFHVVACLDAREEVVALGIDVRDSESVPGVPCARTASGSRRTLERERSIRLGAGPVLSSAAMLVILNADDFGLSPDTVAATIECLEAGLLTSATLMAGMPATAEAVRYAAGRPDVSFGVHLAFVGGAGEHALSDPATVPSLVHADGSFRAARETRIRALLRRLPQEQIEREVVAQVSTLRDAGVPVSHVDSHRHLHKFAVFRRALEAVLPELGIRRVRASTGRLCPSAASQPDVLAASSLGAASRRSFATTDHFYMPTSAGDVGWSPLAQRLDALGGATIEVGVHPGLAEPWRRREREDLAAFVAAARAAGHQLVSWHEISEPRPGARGAQGRT